MAGDRTYKPRGRWRTFRLTSHRLGIILIVLSLVWGMYLIHVQLNDRRSQSEYLKEKIITLSKEYIDAIAKEKGLYTTELGDSDNGKKCRLPVFFQFACARIIYKFVRRCLTVSLKDILCIICFYCNPFSFAFVCMTLHYLFHTTKKRSGSTLMKALTIV